MKHLSRQSRVERNTIFTVAHSRIEQKTGHRSRVPRPLSGLLISTAVLIATSASVNAAEAAAPPTSNVPIFAAVAGALLTGIFSIISLILSNNRNARLAREAQEKTAESERKQRQQELALKIVDTVAKDRSAARRFAIGLVKVEKVGDTEEENRSNERGRVYFLPINSRVTVGRDPDNDNDIPLREDKLGDRNRELSRFQCGFVADEHTVVVEDFASANDTLISDPSGSETRKIGGAQVKFKVVQRQQLKDRDLIWVGPFVLRFVKLQENKILAQ